LPHDDALSPILDERERLLFAATEARVVGRGGGAAVSQATGIARGAIGRGLADLRAAAMVGHVGREVVASRRSSLNLG
jgi:hypothetical protein